MHSDSKQKFFPLVSHAVTRGPRDINTHVLGLEGSSRVKVYFKLKCLLLDSFLELIGWIVNLDLLKAWLWGGGSTGIVTGPLPNGQLSMVNNHVCVGVLLNVGSTLQELFLRGQ